MIKVFKKAELFLSKERNLVLAIFCLALLIRSIFFAAGAVKGELSFAPSVNEDAGQYVTLARNLLAGNGFSRDQSPPYSPDFFRTPGYPVFLALLFLAVNKIWFAALVQIFIASLVPAFLYFLAKRFLGRISAAAPSIVLALEPAAAYWSVQLTTESFFTLILLLLSIALVKFLEASSFKYASWGGILYGAAMLVRPSAEVLLPAMVIPFIAAALKDKKKILMFLVFIVLANALVAPWKIRSSRLFGSFELSSVGGAIGLGKYLDVYTKQKYGLPPAEAFPDLPDPDSVNPFQYAEAVSQKTKETFWRDPLPFLTIAGTSAFPFFIGDGWGVAVDFLWGQGRRLASREWDGTLWSFASNPTAYAVNGLTFWVGKFFWTGITFLFFVGVWSSLRDKNQRTGILFMILIIAITAISAGVGSYSRFRQPVNPYILLFAVLGLKNTWRLRTRGKERG